MSVAVDSEKKKKGRGGTQYDIIICACMRLKRRCGKGRRSVVGNQVGRNVHEDEMREG